jgi:hypothetical protein
MNTNIVKETLTELIKENSDDSGWINLAILGAELSKNGIDYKELGHYKLTNFITTYSDIIEIRKDETHKLPVYYVRIRKNPSVQEKLKIVNSSPKDALTDWAYLKHYQTTFNRLRQLALDERWYYKVKNPNFPYPILSNYLHYTFFKLTKEQGKILKNDEYAVFNTGLVDKRYEPIYALFEKNNQYTQPWKLVEFCIPGESFAGKTLVRNFKDMPKRAHYFNNVADMLYDTRSGEPELDMKHIILDNAGRLPLNFLSENKPKDFTLKNPEILTIENRLKYFKDLAKAIEDDTKTYRSLTNRLKDAISLAIKRVEWNFKTAIPMYYPTENKMSLLLPLSLIDDEIVDIALVVEKTKSGNYIGHTILPLNWAYNNARLVARPDSDWLVAENIETDSDTDDDNSGT